MRRDVAGSDVATTGLTHLRLSTPLPLSRNLHTTDGSSGRWGPMRAGLATSGVLTDDVPLRGETRLPLLALLLPVLDMVCIVRSC